MKNKEPVLQKRKKNAEESSFEASRCTFDPSDLDLTTASTTDCTGLIPAGITDEEEIEHYYELYPYLSKAD